jgi:competence CoiA-like predicted nuclease
MEKNVLHKYAEDINGKIIHINNVLSGIEYYCPECKEKFIFKKGKIRQQHFAHNNTSSNCTGEGYLHKAFKKLLLDYILACINKKQPMHISLRCIYCHKIMRINLLTENCIVKDEYDMEICRPDIALIDEKKSIYAVFEIVVTHKPEENVVKYYQKNNIFSIQIELDSEKNLDNINETLINNSKIITQPDYLICMNPSCISKKKKSQRKIKSIKSRRL